MAITVTTDLTDVNLAEATTNYAVLGTFATAIAASVDTFIQSANTIGGRISLATAWAHTSLTSTDLSINQRHIFQWLKCISIPQLDTKANGGLVITMSSDATPTLVGVSPNDGPSNSKSWFVGGNADSTFGWVCYVVDPNAAASTFVIVNGTPVVTTVQRIGIRGKITAIVGGGSVKPVNIVFDATRYGTGLTYSGDNAGVAGAFSDILTTAMSSANAWGILTSTGSVYFGAGKFNFGTAGQVAITSFKDTNQTFVYQDFPIASTFYEWLSAGAASFLTTVQLGNFVSSIASAGCTVRGAGAAVWTLTVGANSAFKAYASTLSQMRRATLTSTSELRSCTISSFGEITPAGATIDNCTFNTVVTTAPTSGTWALILNAAADATPITNVKFISCNKAIKITAIGTYAFNNWTFSGNTFDVENNSTGLVTINVSGGGGTPTVTNTGAGATTTVVNAVTVKVTCLDAIALTVISGVRVFLTADTGGPLPFQASVTITSAASVATVTHTAHGRKTGEKMVIRGADQPEYNGIHTITVTTVNAYTYTITGTPATPATGTITSTMVILDGLSDGSGIIQDTGFNFPGVQPVTGRARKGTTAPLYATSPIVGSITTAGATLSAFMVPD